jgi:hypothetical protein
LFGSKLSTRANSLSIHLSSSWSIMTFIAKVQANRPHTPPCSLGNSIHPIWRRDSQCQRLETWHLYRSNGKIKSGSLLTAIDKFLIELQEAINICFWKCTSPSTFS